MQNKGQDLFLSIQESTRAYLLAFAIYKGKLQVIILNGFVCPVGG